MQCQSIRRQSEPAINHLDCHHIQGILPGGRRETRINAWNLGWAYAAVIGVCKEARIAVDEVFVLILSRR